MLRKVIVPIAVAIWLAGCSTQQPAANAPVEEFRKYSAERKWYWSQIEGLQSPPTGFDAVTPDFFRKRSQVLLISTNQQTTLIYTELAPFSGLKAFRGSQDLERIEGVDAPLFATGGSISRPTFIGFLNGRAFRVTVQHAENPAEARQAAVALGLHVLQQPAEPLEQ